MKRTGAMARQLVDVLTEELARARALVDALTDEIASLRAQRREAMEALAALADKCEAMQQGEHTAGEAARWALERARAALCPGG